MAETRHYKDCDDYDQHLIGFENHINKTLQKMFDEMDVSTAEEYEDVDFEPYEVKIEFGGVQYIFMPCAAEHNGLLEFIEFVKSEQ